MRKPLVAGNWKMYGSVRQAKTLVNGINDGAQSFSDIDILVLPPFIYLSQIHYLLENSPILLGAQNLYTSTEGAFTGEVSGPMLKEIGCEYVLVGHSERRLLFQENNDIIAAKFAAAIAAKLTPLLCVGESLSERENGMTEIVIAKQLNAVIDAVGIEAFSQAVIGYEPVWAIGTGKTATPEQAQEVHFFIRNLIAKNNVDLAQTIRILYGGSVKPDNAASLFAMPDIDGGLVGGASLDAASFLKICAAASTELVTEKPMRGVKQ